MQWCESTYGCWPNVGCHQWITLWEKICSERHTIHCVTVDVYWRARGCETVKEYSSREIIVLDLTNFSQNDRSRLISWLFSTKNYSYYTSSLFSVNFFSDGYLDHTKNPCWNYQLIVSGVRTLSSSFFLHSTSFFVLCSTNNVTHYRKSVGENKEEKKRLTRGKLVCCALCRLWEALF